MDTMSTPTLVLAVLAVWSITQLATRDTITARPRRWVRQWVRAAGHEVEASMSQAACRCGWVAVNTDSRILVSDPDELTGTPREAIHLTDKATPQSVARSLRDLGDEHVDLARARDTGGYLYTLVTCPWCVSLYIALLVVASALAWGDGWGWQLAAGALGLRILAGAGVVHLGPPDDEDDDG